MKTYDIGKLNEMYMNAESCDTSVFNEMKSAVKLVSGEHYDRNHLYAKDSRDTFLSPKEKKGKVRITKNLIQKITGMYRDGIMSLTPELRVVPANRTEPQDKKAAELYDSVLAYGKKRYRLEEKKEDWCQDLVELSEVCAKVTFNKHKGDFKGYYQKVQDGLPVFLGKDGQETFASAEVQIDPMSGMPTEVPNKPAPDKDRPAFSGDFEFEQIFPADVLRAPSSKSMDESPYLIIRRMMDIEEAKRLIPEDDPEREKKEEYVQKSSEQTYRIFDLNTHTFDDVKGKCLVREYYFRPCYEHPKGYYIIATEAGKLVEDEIPYGVFPIAWRSFQKRQTNPRGTGVVKVARPYQVEINRASSKEIEHQLTHGDDKVFTPTGSKLERTATEPGIRHFKSTSTPVVVPGRAGDQFRPYISATIEELFFAVNQDMKEEDANQLDPVALLYKSVKRKSRYGRFAKQLQYFCEDVYWIYLKLAKHYFDDERKIVAVGRSEAINLDEFKNADPLCVQISLVGSNEDAESQIGKYLMFQNVLQYVGKDLPKETLGKVLVNMPYANSESAFDEMTQTTKNIENDLLALDRGEEVPANQEDEHTLYIKALTHRIKSPDFYLLPDNVQQNYFKKREEHRALEAQAMEQQQRAQMGQIPTDGPLTKADLYVNPDPSQPTKVQRAVFPARALEWLQKKLEEQMLTQDRLAVLSEADQIAVQNQLQPQGDMNGNYAGNPSYGNAVPSAGGAVPLPGSAY